MDPFWGGSFGCDREKHEAIERKGRKRKGKESCVIQEINHQLHNFAVPPPVFRPWSAGLIYWFL